MTLEVGSIRDVDCGSDPGSPGRLGQETEPASLPPSGQVVNSWRPTARTVNRRESPRTAAVAPATVSGIALRPPRGRSRPPGEDAGSSAEYPRRRLDAMDFINRGMLFAATLLLCLFPFLIIANALARWSAATGLARHLGLNKQAAADVGALFHFLGRHLQRHHRDRLGVLHPGRYRRGYGDPGSVRGGLRVGQPGGQGYAAPTDLAGRAGGLLSPGRLGRALATRRGRPGPARGHRPGGAHRLLVVHDRFLLGEGSPGGTCSRPPSRRPCSGWAWRQCSRSSSPAW